jgi:hypothetical protein
MIRFVSINYTIEANHRIPPSMHHIHRFSTFLYIKAFLNSKMWMEKMKKI